MKAAAILLALAAMAPAQINDIAGARIRAHVKFLSGAGDDLAAKYAAAQLALIGAKDGVIRGSELPDEVVVLSAQANRFGIGVLIEIARAWSALPQKPRRSALFSFNDVVPRKNAVVSLHYGALGPAGRLSEVVVIGDEHSAFWPLVLEAARRLQLEVKPGAGPKNGDPVFSIKMDRDQQPSEEYSDEWNFASLEQVARFGFLLGVNAANR